MQKKDWIIRGAKGQRGRAPGQDLPGLRASRKREVGRQRGEKAQEMPSRENTKRAAGCDVATELQEKGDSGKAGTPGGYQSHPGM